MNAPYRNITGERDLPEADPLIGATLETAQIGSTLLAAVNAFADLQSARARNDRDDYRTAAKKLSAILDKHDVRALARHLCKSLRPRSIA